MDRNDQKAIEALFDKLATIERTAPPRDAEAEAYIRDRTTRQPAAPLLHGPDDSGSGRGSRSRGKAD